EGSFALSAGLPAEASPTNTSPRCGAPHRAVGWWIIPAVDQSNPLDTEPYRYETHSPRSRPPADLLAAPRRRGDSTGPSCRHAPGRRSLAAPQESGRLLPFHASAVQIRLGQTGRIRPPPDSRLTGPVAHAHEDAAQPRHSRHDRPPRIHRQQSLFRERSRLL